MKNSIYINLGIGALTLISNSGAAIMMINDPTRWSSANILEALLFAFVGFFLIVLSALAIAKRISQTVALNFQFFGLMCLVSLLISWGVLLLLNSISGQVKISWSFGILSAFALYLVYLSRQLEINRRYPIVNRILVFVCGLGVVVDIGVFIRVGYFLGR